MLKYRNTISYEVMSNFDECDTSRTIGIYLIRNTKNEKVYVGQTVSFSSRWAAHRSMLDKKTHCNKVLLNDWIYFGAEAFEFSVLENLHPISDVLNKRESFWINSYGSLDRKKGYNLAAIGDCGVLICYPCRQVRIGKYFVLKRELDGYIFITGIASMFGRRVADFLARQDVQEYSFMIDTDPNSKYKGTWIHPDIFFLFARWVDVQFRISYNRCFLNQMSEAGETISSLFNEYMVETHTN